MDERESCRYSFFFLDGTSLMDVVVVCVGRE